MTAGLAGDPLLAYRDQFPILARTNYLISNSLGAVPASAAATAAGVRRDLGHARGPGLGGGLVDAGGRPRRPGRAADRCRAGRGRLPAQRDARPCHRLQRVRFTRGPAQDRHRRDALPLAPLPPRRAACGGCRGRRRADRRRDHGRHRGASSRRSTSARRSSTSRTSSSNRPTSTTWRRSRRGRGEVGARHDHRRLPGGRHDPRRRRGAGGRRLHRRLPEVALRRPGGGVPLGPARSSRDRLDARGSRAGWRTPGRSRSPRRSTAATDAWRFLHGTPNIPALYAARAGLEVINRGRHRGHPRQVAATDGPAARPGRRAGLSLHDPARPGPPRRDRRHRRRARLRGLAGR